MERRLDDTDMELLRLLEKNAKMRIHDMAKRLSIPSSTVHHRIKRMEKEGIIEGWTIRKGYGKLGLIVKAYIMIFVNVTALKTLGKTQKHVAREIKKFERVESVDIMAGDADLLVTARCFDMDDLQDMLLEKIQSVEGITKTKTLMVISEE